MCSAKLSKNDIHPLESPEYNFFEQQKSIFLKHYYFFVFFHFHRVTMRRIASMNQVEEFKNSPTFQSFVTFIAALNKAAEGQPSRQTLVSENSKLMKISLALKHERKRLEDFPPLKQASRFGNMAFRSWLSSLEEESETLMKTFSEKHAKELSSYWSSSFGNKTRLDYGTGHEASFMVWLFAISQLFDFEELDLQDVVVCIFPLYLSIVRDVQSMYMLEPAGSHGVWSLDDYHFLPFVFGSSQFGSRDSPKMIRDMDTVRDLSASNMFMNAIEQIRKVKSGPFAEHSPLLNDLAGIKEWSLLNRGLFEMFKGEVLGKFPVAQHFLFGELFPCTWHLSENELAFLDEGSSTKSPFAVIAPHGGDALTKYFGLVHKNHHIESPKSEFELLGTTGISIAGWKIESLTSRISSQEEIDRKLSVEKYKVVDFPLPEMLFGSNVVRITRGNQFTMEFNAFDALLGCKIGFDSEGVPDRSLFKVPAAEKWTSRIGPDGSLIKQWREDFDWTFTTLYSGTNSLEMKPSEESIDVPMLSRRDSILFYSSNILFEDDLFDFGEAKLTVKVRVMSSCMLILSRFWLRVDSTFVRSFDTRVFHVFGKDELIVETTKKECNADDLREKGCTDMKVMMKEEIVEPLLKLLERKKFQIDIPRVSTK